MQEVMTQIFTLIAYLAIALMSVTVPTYAIAISYLAPETSKSMEDMKKRREDLAEKLEKLRKELKEKPGVEAIEGEITKYREEEAKLKSRLEYLSAKGAFGYPFISFMLALIFAAYNIYANEVNLFYSFLSIVTMGAGIYHLGRTMVAIERAALRPEEEFLPAFRVAFISGATVERFKPGEQEEVALVVTNYGKEMAENANIGFLFPPRFEILPKPEYSIFKQTAPGVDYPGYSGAFFDVPVFHMDMSGTLKILVKMPDKPASYDIPVCIRAKRMGKSEHRLKFEIAS